MGWGSWATSGLALGLAGVLAGAGYVAATSDFDAPPPVAAAALPTPGEQARPVAPMDGLAPPGAGPARGRNSTGGTQGPRARALGGRSAERAKSTAKKAKPKPAKAGESRSERPKAGGKT